MKLFKVLLPSLKLCSVNNQLVKTLNRFIYELNSNIVNYLAQTKQLSKNFTYLTLWGYTNFNKDFFDYYHSNGSKLSSFPKQILESLFENFIQLIKKAILMNSHFHFEKIHIKKEKKLLDLYELLVLSAIERACLPAFLHKLETDEETLQSVEESIKHFVKEKFTLSTPLFYEFSDCESDSNYEMETSSDSDSDSSYSEDEIELYDEVCQVVGGQLEMTEHPELFKVNVKPLKKNTRKTVPKTKKKKRI